MKLNTQLRKVEIISPPTQKSAFKINASAHAFNVLSSGIYSDPIKAIIRELSCNALDAHQQVGNSDPFRINLPSALNPSLVIRDYGPGLSHEAIQQIYTVYFLSDKTHTNEQIGGLGLGSKTPFSYVDTFTVASYQDGHMHLYAAFKDENNEPQIMLTEQGPVEKPNGLEITIPVKQKDFDEFSKAAEDVLRFFPEGSYLIPGYSFDPTKFLIRGSIVSIRNTTNEDYYQRSKHYVLMGPVAYEVTLSAVPNKVTDKYEPFLRMKGIVLHAPIGALTVQASREALSYDKPTVTAIDKLFAAASAEIKNLIQTQINACKTKFDALKLLHELEKSVGNTPKDITYNGEELKLRWNIEHESEVLLLGKNDFYTQQGWRCKRRQRPAINWAHNIVLDLKNIPATILFAPKLPANYVKHLNWLFGNHEDYFPILIVKHQNVLDELKKWLGELNWSITFDDLPKIPPSVRTSETKARVKIKRYKLGGYYPYNVEFDGTIDDLNSTTSACWIRAEGRKDAPCTISEREYKNMCQFMNWSVTCFHIPRTLKRQEKHLTIPHIEDYVRGRYLDWLTEEKYLLIHTDLNRHAYYSSLEQLLHWLDDNQEVLKIYPNSLLAKAYKEFPKDFRQLSDSMGRLRIYLSLLGWDQPSTRTKYEIQKYRKTQHQRLDWWYKELRRTYPLLFTMGRTRSFHQISHYLHLVENCNAR